MTTYQKPTEDLIAFNSSVFTTANEEGLTLSEAQSLFLGRTGTPTSTATSTTFNGTLTTGTINGVVLFTDAGGGTKIGTGNSNTTVSANCILLGDNIGLGGAASHTNHNVLVGSNISSDGQNLKQCVAVGTAIMKTAQNQVNNVAVGFFSCNGGGSSNTTAVGANSARNSAAGQNVAVGSSSLYANTTGTDHVAIGYNAFSTGATFSSSTAIGASTVIGASSSTAIGYGATTSVDNSIVLGRSTETVYCVGTTTNGSLIASADIFVNGIVRAGVGLFKSGTDASVNTAFGRNVLIATTSATNCSAFGNGAMTALTTGEGNTCVGSIAGNAIIGGAKNTAVGSACLKTVTSGSRNTGCGNAAGQVLSTGSENTLYGYLAGGNLSGASNNTFVGSTVSSGSSVSNSSALGAFSGVSTFSNSTAIGGGTSAAIPGAICSAANQIMLGRATEFVECAGTDGTNGCLKLNGGVKLQTTYSSTPTSTMLGFQLTNTTGFAIASFTSGSATNISSAGIVLTAGIWNIDYSIELLIASSSATVQAQTLFCSLTTGGAYATQRISNSGITRILSTNTYASADTPCFSGSFNYYASSSTTVFPVFQITFTAGPTISGTGFYRATRVG